MRELRVYKPTKNGSGSAASFQLTAKGKYKEPMIFLTLAKQGANDENGNNSFGWKDKENAITVKLNELDAAKVLLVLFGMEKNLGDRGLYHDPGKSGTGESNQGMSKTIQLQKNEDKPGYYLSVSAKQGDKLTRIGVSVDQAEAVQLKILMNGFIERYYLGE